MKTKLIVALVLTVAGYLGGFIPQHSKVELLRQQLAGRTQQLGIAQSAVEAAGLQVEGLLMYFEATRKNYGLAAEHAARFFHEGNQLAGASQDAAAKQALQDILQAQGSIEAELAAGNPAVVPHLQALIAQLEAAMKAPAQ